MLDEVPILKVILFIIQKCFTKYKLIIFNLTSENVKNVLKVTIQKLFFLVNKCSKRGFNSNKQAQQEYILSYSLKKHSHSKRQLEELLYILLYYFCQLYYTFFNID